MGGSQGHGIENALYDEIQTQARGGARGVSRRRSSDEAERRALVSRGAKVTRVLSFGGGVNSVALLLRSVRDGCPPDFVIMADTGEEDPRTYDYVRARIVPFCDSHNIPFAIVRSPLGRMVNYYSSVGAVPSVQRRDCTDKFKIRPVTAELRRLGLARVELLVGFALDEAHRMRDNTARFITNAYPLIEWGMTRQACEAEIRAAGWPSPGKSGCRGCPFAGRRGLGRLLREDPVDFARWQAMENGARERNSKIRLVPGLTLNRLAGDPEAGERRLDAFGRVNGGECVVGGCGLDSSEVET